jgi:predicted ATPase
VSEEEIAALAAQLEEDLIKRYDTHVVTGEQLRKALGYRSIDALRQAIVRKTIPVTVFSIENRRGKHALVKDIARWLAENARGNNEGGD